MPGETWPVTRDSINSTLTQEMASGIEIRAPLYPQRRFKWTLTYDALMAAALGAGPLGAADFQAIMGFIGARNGSFDTFLYKDPDDNNVTAQVIGTGDGSTTTFQMKRTMSGATDQVFGMELTTPAPLVYLNGTLQSSGYTINSSGLLTFSSAPGGGVSITATFTYYWRVRLDEDTVSFEAFAQSFYALKKLSLISARA